MSYIDKCIKTRETAKICYDKAIYDSCVNRYYYSFYQELMHELSVKKIKIEDECEKDNIGSHVKAFNAFKKYLKDVKKFKMKRVTTINGNFIKFKKLREKADYDEEMLSKEEADEAIDTYNVLQKEFKYL